MTATTPERPWHETPYWIDDGWRDLVRRLLLDVDGVLSPDHRAKMTLSQVKEKYAGLVVHWRCEGIDGSTRQAVQALIDKAAAASKRTCQRCGEPGAVFGLWAWYATLCARHLAQALAERRPWPQPDNLAYEYGVAVGDDGTAIRPVPDDDPVDVAERTWRAAADKRT